METITTYGVGPDQPTYAQLREQNRVLENALKLCVERLEGLKEDGITKAEQHALDAAQAALLATSQEGQG